MKKQLFLCALITLIAGNLKTASSTEFDISQNELQTALDDIAKTPDATQPLSSTETPSVDLQKINASVEKSPVSFALIEQSIESVEKELSVLKTNFAEIKDDLTRQLKKEHQEKRETAVQRDLLVKECAALKIERNELKAEVAALQAAAHQEIDVEAELQDDQDDLEHFAQVEDISAEQDIVVVRSTTA